MHTLFLTVYVTATFTCYVLSWTHQWQSIPQYTVLLTKVTFDLPHGGHIRNLCRTLCQRHVIDSHWICVTLICHIRMACIFHHDIYSLNIHYAIKQAHFWPSSWGSYLESLSYLMSEACYRSTLHSCLNHVNLPHSLKTPLFPSFIFTVQPVLDTQLMITQIGDM
jgi:hypothetical protein